MYIKNILRALLGTIICFLALESAFATVIYTLDYKNIRHEIGTTVIDYSAFRKKAIFWDKTLGYGNLMYGNSLELQPGTYEALFSLKAGTIGVTDILANIGIESLSDSGEGYYRELSGKDFTGGYQVFKLVFKISKATAITPYVYLVGTSSLWVDSVSINTTSSVLSYPIVSAQQYIYEEEEFSRSTGEMVVDSAAGNGKVFKATSANRPGFLSFGPYSLHEAIGNHRAVFRLKTDDIKNPKVIAKIEVFNSEGNGVNKFRKIRGTDFSSSGAFQEFVVEYARTASGSLEFKTFFYGSGMVVLDRVTSIGAFVQKPLVFSDFGASIIGDGLSVSFSSDRKLKTPPVLSMGGRNLVFKSEVSNHYNYSLSGMASMENGTYPITLVSATDLFDNTASSLLLGRVTVLNVPEETPLEISDISISSQEAKSFETVRISFSVNKELRQIPTVQVGQYPASHLSNGSGRYIFEYQVNDYAPKPTDVERAISVMVKSEKGDVLTAVGPALLLHLDNANLVEETENLPAAIGEIVSDDLASNKKARQGKPGQSGYLQFGPYSDNITQGVFHIARFRLKTQSNTSTKTLAIIDVVNTNGNGERVYKQVRGTDFRENDAYQDFELKFLRSTSWVVEYRVYLTGEGDITADSVTISNPVKTQNEVYESEDLYGVTGDVVSDASASQGSAIKASVATDAPGTFQFGPYKTLLKSGSSYTAKFRLKTPLNTSTTAIGLIDVYDDITGYREYREIKASDFDAAGAYQDFDIDFRKPLSDNIEFRIFFYGKQDLWADKVEISEIIKPRLPDYESENLPSSSGIVVVDPLASGQLARTSRFGIDQEGAMQFGPYDDTNLVDGQPYKATFRMKTPSNVSGEFIALIDVYNGDAGYRKYREIKATDFDAGNQYQNFEINFIKPSGSKNMEYRVFFYNKQDLTVDNVIITDGIYEGLPVYESENLPSNTGVVVRDAGASNGKKVFFDMNRFQEGWAQFGPYKIENVNIGENYKAHFKLQTDNILNTEIIAILNVYNSDKSIDYQLPIKGSDFASVQTFQDFTIDFPMLDKDLMEFRVYATGKGNFSIDKISLSK